MIVMSRSPMVGAPPCPRPGHDLFDGYRVSLDGTYGHVTTRQRYRCTAPDRSFHRYTPPLPREHTTGGVLARKRRRVPVERTVRRGTPVALAGRHVAVRPVQADPVAVKQVMAGPGARRRTNHR